MMITGINVIPPNVPSARLDSPAFGQVDVNLLRQQKADLDNLSNDKLNPLAGTLKFLAIITSALITAGAMKLSLNKSLEILSKVAHSKTAMKITQPLASFFKTVGNAIKKDSNMIFSSIGEKFNTTKFGTWFNEKTLNSRNSIKTLIGEIIQVIKDKKPEKLNLKDCIVDAASILAGIGVALKEAGVVTEGEDLL